MANDRADRAGMADKAVKAVKADGATVRAWHLQPTRATHVAGDVLHDTSADDIPVGDTGPTGFLSSTNNAPVSPASPANPLHPTTGAMVVLSRAQILAARPRQTVEGCVLVVRSEGAHDRVGRPYLQLTLRGADGGNIEGRWWRYPYPLDRRPTVGQVCWLRARCDDYAGERQLTIVQARPAPHVGPEAFARATRRTGEELQRELEARIASLEPWLQALVRNVLDIGTNGYGDGNENGDGYEALENREVSGSAWEHDVDVYERFCTWPAAQRHHGAVRHGLLAHSLRVEAIAHHLADAYGPGNCSYDYDVVTAACLLHDVGKVYTLPAVAGAALPPAAQQCDHVTRGVLMIQAASARWRCHVSAERLENLLHCVLAHHGRKEWGAPVEPQTVEAWLVHLADLAESRMWSWSREEES